MAKKLKYSELYTRRKDGLYMAYYRDQQGKRRSLYDRDPKRLFERLQEKENGVDPALMFETAADAWELKHWERIGGKTAEAYTAPLRRIKEHFSGTEVEEVSALRIQAFLADLGKRGFSRRSVQMHRDILNMIFNNAIIEFGLRFNPCVAVTIPRNLPTKKREIPKDDAMDAVRAGADQPFGLFALVCLYAGLRRGEALALRYEDIDRGAGIIHVTKAVEFVGNNPHVKPPKTDAGVRDVPLLRPLADALPNKKRGLVFAREDGTLLTKSAYRRSWEKYCAAIGYEITAHQLRHGYATILYEAGIPDKDAQELLGHSSIAVTRDVYTHIRSVHRQETVRKLNEFVVKAVV